MKRSSDEFVFQDPPHAALLRARIRRLLAEHLPENWLGPFTEDPGDLAISNRFCELLASEGLLVPNWPAEYGGQDADLATSVVIREEMWAHFEPRGGQYYGPNWVGPSILHYGTPEQKALHLPLIAAGKAIWCQGFSEPDAGSDLANLSTRAERDGEGFRITGQKTWTSWARWAEWCYLLARVTGMGSGRHDGITVFLVPMDRVGITVRGLDGIPGPHHLNEVFLDDVWAATGEVLGEVGNGWQVIRDALSNERVGIARYARGDRLLGDVLADDRLRVALSANRWLEAQVRNRMARLLCRRALWFQEAGGSHDFVVSAARMVTTRADLAVSDAIAEAVGDAFFEDRYVPDARLGGAAEWYWRYMQAGTIASGTTEMLQRLLSRCMFRGERIRVTEGAHEIRSVIDRLVVDHGGLGAAREALAEPSSRVRLAKELDAILDSLDVTRGHTEGVAAAEVCRAAGYGLLPLPVEAMLLRRPGGEPLAIPSVHGRLEHSDLFDLWHLVVPGGQAVHAVGGGGLLGSKVGPFVNRTPLPVVGEAPGPSVLESAMLQVLPSWYLLGALEKALELATIYASERVAFGSPIASYQGVSFPIADAGAELQGLYELALHGLWSAYQSHSTAVVDGLALRWAAIDIGRRVLRTAHQVLGAVGLCDEHDLAVITLGMQARLRLPLDRDAAMTALADAVAQSGFEGLFSQR